MVNNMDIEKIKIELQKPIKKEDVAERKGGLKKPNLKYLESYFVIQQANRIFGENNWSMEVKEVKELNKTITKKQVYKDDQKVYKDGLPVLEDNYEVLFTSIVKITVNGFGSKEDVGSCGGSSKSSFLEATEIAYKGCVSDGMKRAFRTFGDQFGNSLYDKDFKFEEEKPAKPTVPDAIKAKPVYNNTYNKI
jgi:DNA repair and recombination protein RAD52